MWISHIWEWVLVVLQFLEKHYGNRDVGDEGMKVICRGLSKLQSLEDVDFSLMAMGVDGAIAITELAKLLSNVRIQLDDPLGQILKDRLPHEVSALSNEQILAYVRSVS